MAVLVEPRKHMARSYRDGSKLTTGHVADTRREALRASLLSFHQLPVSSGWGAGESLGLPLEADEPLGRVGQLDVGLVGNQVEHTLPKRLVELSAPSRICKKAHRQADPVVPAPMYIPSPSPSRMKSTSGSVAFANIRPPFGWSPHSPRSPCPAITSWPSANRSRM